MTPFPHKGAKNFGDYEACPMKTDGKVGIIHLSPWGVRPSQGCFSRGKLEARVSPRFFHAEEEAVLLTLEVSNVYPFF